MNDRQLAAYLERLAHGANLRPDFATLRSLHRAHLEANLRIAALRLSEEDLQAVDSVLARSMMLDGDVYALERDTSGRHGAIMKYNLNSEGKATAPRETAPQD